MQLPSLKDAKIEGKTIFLRADLDVPLSEFRIQDDSRLKAALPTIEYLIKHNAKVIIAGHLGRPKGSDKSLSLEPVARWFGIKYKVSSIKYGKRGEFGGWEIDDKIFLLENLRFYKGEEENDAEFSKKLASLADIYVNDAFAMCHRNHASIVGITKFLPHFAGFHLEKEISVLSKVFQNPRRPLAVVIGGKKIETKLPLVARMYSIADYVLVGGKIAQEHKEFLKIEHQKIDPLAGRNKAILLVADLNEEGTGMLENSLNNFVEIIERAKTIIWNGTMGKIENNDDFGQATRKIAEAIIKTKSYSVVGGGDTTEFLRKMGIIDKFSFASTGGGAMLAFLSGEKLPGIEALKILNKIDKETETKRSPFRGTVRHLREEDLRYLKPILEEWIRDRDTHELFLDEIAEDLQFMKDSIFGANDRTYMVAEDVDGEIVGIIGFKIPTKKMLDFCQTSSPIELVNAFVASKHRKGRGVGKALVTKIEEEARSRGYKEIILNSGPRYEYTGWGFYDKLVGYERVGIAKRYYTYYIKGGDAVVWRKTL